MHAPPVSLRHVRAEHGHTEPASTILTVYRQPSLHGVQNAVLVRLQIPWRVHYPQPTHLSTARTRTAVRAKLTRQTARLAPRPPRPQT